MKTPEEWSRKIYDECPSPVSGRTSVNSEFVRSIQADALRRLVEACGSIDNDISTPAEWDEAYAEARAVLDSENNLLSRRPE